MEKDAIIYVQSFSDLTPGEPIEVVTPGKFIKTDDGFKAIYEESKLSGMEGTTTTLNIKNDSMILERLGSTTTNMEFKEGEVAISLYNTPYGMMDLNVVTKKLDIDIDDNGGVIYSKYILGVQGEAGVTTELKVKIRVN